MSINKNILFAKLEKFIKEKYQQPDKELIIKLCKQIIFNDPTKSCIIKGKQSDWNDLPATKSLFQSAVNCGLPIGNLTSQVFANFYMDTFDHYIKHDHFLHTGQAHGFIPVSRSSRCRFVSGGCCRFIILLHCGIEQIQFVFLSQ